MEKTKLGMSRKRSDTNLLVENAIQLRRRTKPVKQRTPLARRLSYGVGHVLNDFIASLVGSYMLVFQTKILGLSNQSTGIIFLASTASDIVLTLMIGYACDTISIPYLSKLYGRRKLWHLFGTILMAGLFPFLFMPCFLCGNGASEWVLLSYYLVLTVFTYMGWSTVQVAHLALIPEIAKRPGEMVELNALRSVFAFLSGIFMYTVTWVMLDSDSSQEDLSPDQWKDFMKLAVIATGTGCFFSLIFHLGTVESKPRQREETPELQGREKARSRTRSFRALTGKAIDGVCYDYTAEDDFEMKKHSDSFPSSCTGSVLDAIEEDMSLDNPAFRSDNNDPNGNTTRVLQPSCHNISSQEATNAVGETSVSVQVDIDDSESGKERPFSVSNPGFLADDEDDDKIRNTLRETNRGRSASVRSVQVQFDAADTRSCRTDSSGFVDEYNSTKDAESMISVDPHGGVSNDHSQQELADKYQVQESFEAGPRNVRSVSDQMKKEDICSSAGKITAIIIEDVDYQEKLEAAKLKAAAVVSWKDWFKKPLFYKVSFAYMCMHLVKMVPRIYLPLYLSDTLRFKKEAIAYFPIVILVSGVLSSATAKKLDKILGIKWAYSLAATLVIGSSAWFFFLEESDKQSVYCAAILLGCGGSVMYVTSLALTAELIGENKESGAFVYAAMTILAKVTIGMTVVSIQEFFPTDGSSGEYIRHMFSIVPGIASIVGLMAVLAFFPATVACRKIVHMVDADTQTDDLDVCYDDRGLKIPGGYE